MNWGKLLKFNAACYVVIMLLSVSNRIVASGIDKSIPGCKTINQENYDNLKATKTSKVFSYQASVDGLTLLRLDYKNGTKGVVTVMEHQSNDILFQKSFDKDLQFIAKGGCDYVISWAFKSEDAIVDWSIQHEQVLGLMPSSPVEVTTGVHSVSYSDQADKWFLFSAPKDGVVNVTTAGLTNENTCMFVYKVSSDVIIASSNSSDGTLQADADLEVKSGQEYLIKWSCAFTNKRHDWRVSYK
ncbi:hypothetical protein [Carboxylicivirga sp. M1479]|uniref:hypothetical protein n=1 Tax=Carboxylicivirga sp. M1479 TaxID=2594476 RepID=UPI001178599C|nr:hypothetical protein [Carboxylicivirga sp. M1479]TRX60353.1 hypothetical protein FNN09_20725 [Carboxylicivirga sp. M1479]